MTTFKDAIMEAMHNGSSIRYVDYTDGLLDTTSETAVVILNEIFSWDEDSEIIGARSRESVNHDPNYSIFYIKNLSGRLRSAFFYEELESQCSTMFFYEFSPWFPEFMFPIVGLIGMLYGTTRIFFTLSDGESEDCLDFLIDNKVSPVTEFTSSRTGHEIYFFVLSPKELINLGENISVSEISNLLGRI